MRQHRKISSATLLSGTGVRPGDNSMTVFNTDEQLAFSSRVNHAVEGLSRHSMRATKREAALTTLLGQCSTHTLTVNKVLLTFLQHFFPDYTDLIDDVPPRNDESTTANDILAEQVQSMKLLKAMLIALNNHQAEQDQVVWMLSKLNQSADEEDTSLPDDSLNKLEGATEELTEMVIRLQDKKSAVAVFGSGVVSSDNPLFDPEPPQEREETVSSGGPGELE